MRAEDFLGRQIGDYNVEAIIGRGSMTVVYRAVAERQGEPVALKVLLSPLDNDEVQVRFRREVAVVQRLDHPGIVPVLDFGQVDGCPFLVMPLLTGGSLAERLRAAGKLDEKTAIDLAWQVADALHYAHTQGVIHRDVKPSNILLTADGRALLADFGVARALDDPKLTRTGLAVGTPFYMAPEQAEGKRDIDGRADLYALGVVLFQLVTGQPPFQGSTPQILYAHVHETPPAPSALAEISAALETLILRVLAKDPAGRFQSGAEMADALAHAEEAGGDEQTQTQLEALAQPRRSLRWGLAAGLIILISGLGWWFSRSFLDPSASATPLTNTPQAVIDTPLQPLALASPSFTPSEATNTLLLSTTTNTSTSLVATNTATLVSVTKPLTLPTATTLPLMAITPIFSPTAPAAGAVTGPIDLYPVGAVIKGSGDGVFRVASERRLQHIFDWETFLAFGFQEPEIVQVDDAVLSAWPEGGELTRVIQAEDGVIYWVVDESRWAIERWQEALEILGPSPADASLLAQLPLTQAGEDLPPGTLLAADSDEAPVYTLFSGGMLRRLADRTLLAAYGYAEADIVRVPDPVLLAYDGGPLLTALIQPAGTETIFLLEAGRRRPMPTGDDLWALGYGVEDISTVPVAFAEQFPLLAEETGETPATLPAPPAVTATETPTEIPTATPTTEPVLSCDIAPADFLADLWSKTAGLPAQTGCPLGPGQTTNIAWQPFEGGNLLWREDRRLIYILLQSGTWSINGDIWREGDPEFDPAIQAPDGFYQPVRGFGTVWREVEGVRDALGWGLNEEIGLTVEVQLFEHGFALGPINAAEDEPGYILWVFDNQTFRLVEATSP